jgi:hypothetical protein
VPIEAKKENPVSRKRIIERHALKPRRKRHQVQSTKLRTANIVKPGQFVTVINYRGPSVRRYPAKYAGLHEDEWNCPLCRQELWNSSQWNTLHRVAINGYWDIVAECDISEAYDSNGAFVGLSQAQTEPAPEQATSDPEAKGKPNRKEETK